MIGDFEMIAICELKNLITHEYANDQTKKMESAPTFTVKVHAA